MARLKLQKKSCKIKSWWDFSANSNLKHMQFNYVWVTLSPQLWSFGSFPHSRTNLSAQTECIFNSLTCLKKPIFSKQDLLRWNAPGCTGIFWPAEGTSPGPSPILRASNFWRRGIFFHLINNKLFSVLWYPVFKNVCYVLFKITRFYMKFQQLAKNIEGCLIILPWYLFMARFG